MKKFLALSLLLGAIAFAAPSANAATAASQPTPQEYRYGQNRRVVRVVNKTRIVRQGFRTFRERIQTRYFANGRTTTRVISRVRIR